MSPVRFGHDLSSLAAGRRPPWWSRSTIASAPCGLQLGNQALAVAASSAKVTPATPDGVTIIPVSFSVMPMKPILIRAEFADRRAREQRSAVRVEDVGGEEVKIGAGERLERARLPRRVYFSHPPRCIRMQLARARVEFVIADRVQLEPDADLSPRSSARRGYSAEASGLAPIMSPADTVIVSGCPARSVFDAQSPDGRSRRPAL